MTAIVKTREFVAPARTRAGVVVPGLGHLLVGEWIIGGGLLALDALWLLAAVRGLPRLGTLFGGQELLHPLLAVLSFVGLTVGLGWAGYRRAYPRVLTEQQYNSNGQIFLRTLGRHRTGMLGLFGVIFLVSMTLLTPMLAPFDPDQVDVGAPNLAPGGAYWFGTDLYGRDVFSRLLYGGRISLSIGLVAVGIAAFLGTSLGAIAGYLGGLVDRVITFVTDGLLSMPRLVLLLTIVGLFRVQGAAGIFLIVAILGLTAWMGIARIVRGEVLSLKQREFVQAARALGFSQWRILFGHLIPNALAPVIVFCSLAMGTTMLAEAGLSFLGLGVPPPTSTWGVMVDDGRDYLRTAPWVSIFPGLAIMVAVLSFNLLGDGLRDATDPKLRGTD
ncbi:MAG: ABC transporter permease [Myxococcota bacterium]